MYSTRITLVNAARFLNPGPEYMLEINYHLTDGDTNHALKRFHGSNGTLEEQNIDKKVALTRFLLDSEQNNTTTGQGGNSSTISKFTDKQVSGIVWRNCLPHWRGETSAEAARWEKMRSARARWIISINFFFFFHWITNAVLARWQWRRRRIKNQKLFLPNTHTHYNEIVNKIWRQFLKMPKKASNKRGSIYSICSVIGCSFPNHRGNYRSDERRCCKSRRTTEEETVRQQRKTEQSSNDDRN